jgi:hypothetical protein
MFGGYTLKVAKRKSKSAPFENHKGCGTQDSSHRVMGAPPAGQITLKRELIRESILRGGSNLLFICRFSRLVNTIEGELAVPERNEQGASRG